jgi:hypothetical protein
MDAPRLIPRSDKTGVHSLPQASARALRAPFIRSVELFFRAVELFFAAVEFDIGHG